MVKAWGATPEVPRELQVLSRDEGGGMRSVAVKCLDSSQNADCEGSRPGTH